MKKGGTIARDSKNQPKKPSEKPLQIPAEKSGVVRLVFTATFVILLLLCLWLYRQLLELILKHGSGWGFDKDSCLVLGGVIVLLSLSLVAMYMLVRVYEVFPPIDVNKSAQDNGLPRMLWLWKPIISDIQRSKSRVEGLLLAFFSYLLNTSEIFYHDLLGAKGIPAMGEVIASGVVEEMSGLMQNRQS